VTGHLYGSIVTVLEVPVKPREALALELFVGPGRCAKCQHVSAHDQRNHSLFTQNPLHSPSLDCMLHSILKSAIISVYTLVRIFGYDVKVGIHD
jgi:hypothetical protein